MKIGQCCCLCVQESDKDGDDLIWFDGMQLCPDCYNKYTHNNNFDKRSMLLNAIKKYRNLLRKDD